MKIGVAIRAQIGAVVPVLPLLNELVNQGHTVVVAPNSQLALFEASFPTGLRVQEDAKPSGSDMLRRVSDRLRTAARQRRDEAQHEMAQRVETSTAGGAPEPIMQRLAQTANHATIDLRVSSLLSNNSVWAVPHPSLGMNPLLSSSAIMEDAWRFESSVESQIRAAKKMQQEFSLVEALIEADHPDLLIVDPLVPGGQFAAETYGIPHVSIVHHSLNEEASSYYLYDRYWKAKDLSRPDSFATQQAPDGFPNWWNGMRELFGLRPDIRPRREWLWLPMSKHGTALFSHPLLRSSQRSLPAYVRLCRPQAWAALPGVSDQLDAASTRMQDPSDSRPRVVLTTASQWQDDVSLVDAVAHASERNGWQLTITAPTNQQLSVDEGVYKFVPHRPVMALADVVVSHGGRGSVEAALDCRVPLVVSPQTIETALIADRVQELGVGLNIKRDTIKSSVGAAIETVMAPSFDAPSNYELTYTRAAKGISMEQLATQISSGVEFASIGRGV